MTKICEKTFLIANDIILHLGMEIVDIEYKSIYNEYNLTIFIFKKGGVTLEDCETVTKAIEEKLEEADVTSGVAYNLNISSTGLDRLIVTDDDYRRSLDTVIELLFLKSLKKKNVKGTLDSYDENTLTIIDRDKKQTFDKADCRVVRPFINFK